MLFSALLFSASALFLDEAGVTDWSRSGLGAFKDATFQARRLYVTTELGVLAALSTRSGQIAWRRVYADGASIEQMTVGKETVATLSGDGRLLHAWKSADGSLLWDAAVGSDGSDEASASALVHVHGAKGQLQGFAVLARGQVEMVGAKTGRRAWSWSDASGTLRPEALLKLRDATATSPGALHVVCARAGTDDAVVVVLDAMTGEATASVTHEGGAQRARNGTRSPIVVLQTQDRSRAALVALGEEGESLVISDIVDGAVQSTTTTAKATAVGAVSGDASLLNVHIASGAIRAYALDAARWVFFYVPLHFTRILLTV
jgi:outer membrane protein assembly factor BamB